MHGFIWPDREQHRGIWDEFTKSSEIELSMESFIANPFQFPGTIAEIFIFVERLGTSLYL